MNIPSLKKYAPLSLLLVAVLFGGALCNSKPDIPDPITLKYWTVEEELESLKAVTDSFAANYPYITVDISILPEATYEEELIQAWARGEGPDIFSVRNSHLGKFTSLISPMPAAVNLTEVVTTTNPFGGEEVSANPITRNTVTVDQLGRIFPQVVRDDVVLLHQGPKDAQATPKVFGLPLSLDSLVMFYNKDLLSQARITLPATTWDQFTQHVPKLTRVDIDNNIIESGAAMGTSVNVQHAADLVALLMMQNGATMISGQDAQFARASETQRDYFPGVEAAKFYTSFANPDVEWYSWNANQPDSIEAFINGRAAYFFGYHNQIEQVRDQADTLNFDIAAVPQVDAANSAGSVAYANYWLQSVSLNSSHTNEAWALIQAITTEQARAKQYAELTKKPAALLSLIDEQREDFTLSIFADQSLISQSWYTGKEPDSVEQQFLDMILLINEERLDPVTAVQNTADKVELTL